jgi:aspartate 1-decarboxylase
VRRRLLKSKIHRATVTDADLNYFGSVSIDQRLLCAADIVPYELVTVLDIDNGERFDTYAMRGRPGEICLNGAAARRVQIGDLVILLTWADLEPAEVESHEPTILFVDEHNDLVGGPATESDRDGRRPR